MKPEIMEGIHRHIKEVSGLENAEILEIRPGHARIKILIDENALNLYGNLHGGFIYSLCDMVSGMSTYAYEVPNVTMQGNISYIKAFQTGLLYVEGNAIHKGSRTAVVQANVTTEDGKQIAAATFTMFITGKL